MSDHRIAVISLLAISLAGCGRNDGDNVTTFVNSTPRGTLLLTADGGSSNGDFGSRGGWGADLSWTAGGSIFAGVNPPPMAPILPVAPTSGIPVGSWIDGRTIASGTAIIDGSVTASTTGFAATLTVTTGDLVINGTLTASDNGFDETSIVLNVPAGTVWILGTIRTGRVDGVPSGDNAGSLDINALRIVFAGTIEARGENGSGGIGGDGGVVTFATDGGAGGQTSQILSGGAMNLAGGNASGIDAESGDGGCFRTYRSAAANGAIHVIGTSFACGAGAAKGSGSVRGGTGGLLDLQGDAGVFFNASFAGLGGNATATSGSATGGRGGDFFVNDRAIPDSGPVRVFGSVAISGGSATGEPAGGGDAGVLDVRSGSDLDFGVLSGVLRGGVSSGSGGEGGFASIRGGADIHIDGAIDVSDGGGGKAVTEGPGNGIDIETTWGDILISGSFLANGGDGSDESDLTSGPSDGGFIGAHVAVAGSITILAHVQANGGLDSDDADGNDGASGGRIRFLVANSTGSIYLDPGSLLQADGGNAGGTTPAPFGGDGGLIELHTGGGSVAAGTFGGNIRLRGLIVARGGSGLPFTGSFGGFGGEVFVASDSALANSGGADGRGGDITLHSGATIDVSGGPGGSGGDGLNDYAPTVTYPTAVTFDADGDDSDNPADNGIILNLGLIVAQGTGPSCWGGDVLFDGLDPGLNPGPEPGYLDLYGNAVDGDYLGR